MSNAIVKALVRNVFQFVTILNQSCSSLVRQWDDLSFNNALDWADYCQGLYYQLKDADCENGFNSQLSQMTMLLQPCSFLQLTLESFRDAKLLLISTLLVNSNLSTWQQQKLKLEFEKTQYGEQIMTEVNGQVWKLRSADSLYRALIVSSQDSKELSLKADLIMTHLIQIFKTAKKEERFRTYCHNIFDCLSGNSNSKIVLFHLLQTSVNGKESEETYLGDLIISYLLEWFHSYIKRDPFCLQDTETRNLAISFTKHQLFFKIYLDAFLARAEDFKPVVSSSERSVIWKNSCGDDFETLAGSFHRLFLGLTSVNDHAKKAEVIKILNERVHKDGFSIWRSLVVHLLKLIKQDCLLSVD